MQLSIKGRQIDVGDAFRVHAEDSLTTIFDKYFGDAIESSVTVSRAGPLFRVVVSSHVGRGLQVESSAEAADVYPAFDAAAERLSKRLRRYKRRLRDHHHARPVEPAASYVIADFAEEEEVSADYNPTIIAEETTELATLTVGGAVVALDLSDAPVVVFRHAAHGGINVVYRRGDGHIGWIDPSRSESESSSER